MKKFAGKILCLMLLSALTLTGCFFNQRRQIVYTVGVEYTFKYVTVKLENDEAREQFVLYYHITKNEGKDSHFFGFTLIYQTNVLSNSEQFEYSDNLGSEIEFDENGYYVFHDSRIFYVSYKNADEDMKSIIRSHDYSIELPIATFAYQEFE